jgi:hypothetical protein
VPRLRGFGAAAKPRERGTPTTDAAGFCAL